MEVEEAAAAAAPASARQKADRLEYTEELPLSSGGRIQWVISGIPLRPHPTDKEVAEAVGAVTNTQTNVTHVKLRDTGKKNTTFGFAHTEGVTEGLHKAVREGVPMQWQGRQVRLGLAQYVVRSSDFMKAPVKLHGMASVEKVILHAWINRVTGFDEREYKVEKLGYDSEVNGKEGAVYGVFVRNLEWARRLYFLLQINVDKFATDVKGVDVKDWHVVMPYIGENMREDEDNRKIFLRGTGRISSKQLARCLAAQVDVIARDAVDVFCLKDKDGNYTGSAFLQMAHTEAATQIMEDYVLVNTAGYAMEADWAIPRRGEKRSYAAAEGGRRYAAAAGRAWTEAPQKGWVEAPPGGAQPKEVAEMVVKEMDVMLMTKYPHLARANEMQKVVEAGIEAKRQMFERIVHEENKMLYNNLVGWFEGIKIAVEKIGKAVAEIEGLRFENEEMRRRTMEPRVHQHIQELVGQKRQAGPAQGGGSTLPTPVTQESSVEMANSFMGGLIENPLGQQLLGVAGRAHLNGRNGSYSPPLDRRD
jgi:hypothetical protein